MGRFGSLVPRKALRGVLLAAFMLGWPCGVRADPSPYFGVVIVPPARGDVPLGMTVDRDYDGPDDRRRVHQWVELHGAAITWHFDPKWVLKPSDLRWGTRVHVFGNSWDVERVEVMSLGPYELAASVEEFVVEASANRPDKALSRGQLATIAALGSESWFVRDAMSDAMGRAGIKMLRLLIWARHAPDPEIRKRAELLLARLGWEP